MLDLDKEFNTIFYTRMSLFSMIILLSIFLSPLGSVGKAFHGKMYTGVSIQVCLWHSGLAEWGVSEGY